MHRTATLLLLVALWAPPALAEPILHEYVPPPGSADEERAALGQSGLPDMLKLDGQTLPRPDDGRAPARGERVYRGAAKTPPRAKLSMDRTTTHDGVLNYSAEFNPSVVPFKRSAAFDAVAEDFTLAVADPRLRTVPLSRGGTPPDHDAFWGSLLLQLRAGVPVAIPSVAPGARILSYRADPPTGLTFKRNSADVLWVEAARSGQVRLTLLTDAPRSYFAPRIPAGLNLGDVPPEQRPKLPAAVARAAAGVIERLKVDRRGSLKEQLDRLVAYFRAFKAGKMPRDSGNVYRDIALGQRGVCRHRAYAFTITVQALGLPARYVQNEAHAFAEVRVPRLGWVRVDLGGASSELRVHNAKKRVVHEPGPDPFPRPRRFAGSYSQGGGQVSGLDRSQRREGSGQGRPLRLLPAPGDTRASAAPAAGATEPTTGPATAPVGPPAPPPKRATTLMLGGAQRVAYRGEPVRVTGQIRDADGDGVPGLLVEVFLSRDGRVGHPIGSVVSDGEGRFSADLRVPREVPVGRYWIIATSPGNRRYAGASSR